MKRTWLRGGPAEGKQVVPSLRAEEQKQILVDEGGRELDPRKVTGGLVYIKPKKQRGSVREWVFWKEWEA